MFKVSVIDEAGINGYALFEKLALIILLEDKFF
jgi:hypothetical protein